nr:MULTISPECIES: MFS transporter [unclassified Herbaspirillum]
MAIITVVLGLTMAVMDGSIVNLALPTMAHEMHASAAEAIWIVNSYQIAMAVCLLPLASLGEVIGHRRIYLLGLVLFTFASLACTLSGNITQLSLARVLQGLGAAGILSVNTALIRFIYPVRMLGRAVGYNALVAGSASALGPSVAGVILHVASWHWLFLINIPLGLLALSIGLRALPFNPLSARKYDVTSALLCLLFVGLTLYTFDALAHLQGLSVVLPCGVLAAAVLWMLLRLQSASAPMLPLDLLRIPLFGLSISTSICAFAAQSTVLVMLPFLLQNQLGLPAAKAGLLLTTWPITLAMAGLLSGRLSDRIAAGLLGGLGLAVLTAGLLGLLCVQQSTPTPVIALLLGVCGIGFGIFQSPNNRAMISASPRTRSGAASGMLGTARLTGQTLGAALVALILNTSAIPYPVVLYCAASLAGVACVVSLTRLRF